MAFRVDMKEAHIYRDTSYVAIRYRVQKHFNTDVFAYV